MAERICISREGVFEIDGGLSWLLQNCWRGPGWAFPSRRSTKFTPIGSYKVCFKKPGSLR